MDKDNGPDTIQIDDDASRWAVTHAEDVFAPAVRVTLGWHDVESAVERGAVVPAQAHTLWAGWASLSSPQRVALPTAAASVTQHKPLAVLPLLPLEADAPKGSSPGVLLGLTLAAALAGALLSYLLFAI
jgi:hypothetical protein